MSSCFLKVLNISITAGWLVLAVVVVVLGVMDRNALKSVDYGLLMTFVFFFVFPITNLPFTLLQMVS